MAEYNGGYQSYADKVTKEIFFKADDRYTKTATLKAGQVVKALTLLSSDADGKLVAYSGTIAESAIVKLNASLANTETTITAGLTVTASGVVTAAQWAAAILNYVYNGVAAGTNCTVSGTLSGYTVEKYDDDSLAFTSTSGLTNVTDLTATGTASAKVTLVVTSAATAVSSLPYIAGVAVYDSLALDASGSSVDTEIAVYTEASFWADALVWAADANQDFILDAKGVSRACTAFNTGCAGIPQSQADVKVLKRKRQKLVEASEFNNLGFRNMGDYV